LPAKPILSNYSFCEAQLTLRMRCGTRENCEALNVLLQCGPGHNVHRFSRMGLLSHHTRLNYLRNRTRGGYR